MDETKHYLICGATSDLARAFLDTIVQPAKVVLVGRDQVKLAGVTAPRQCQTERHVCDLRDDAAVKALVKKFKSANLKFDGVLCAAGSHEVLPLRLYSKDKFSAMFDSNFFTVSNVLSAVSSVLAMGAGIVVTSSAVTQRGAGAVAGYASAKAAVEGLVRAAALEYAPKKVRVNAIAPGVFRSKMSERFLNSLNDAQLSSLEASHPLGIGDVHYVAGSIKFLMSADAAWITGQTLVVDGGYSINA
jgi:NAD(P)-dependent dehydrogenase (short-subunit alcohol dehydrogenase family)